MMKIVQTAKTEQSNLNSDSKNLNSILSLNHKKN